MDERLNWIISVGDHLIEPPDLWVERVAAADREFAPHVERIDGIDTWIYGDYRFKIPGVVASAGKPRNNVTPWPVNYVDMRPGFHDAKARVADMDADGVAAQLCFPTFARFCGQVFLEAPNKERALRFVKVYNDWHIDEWAAASPGRFIPLIVLPLWDPQLAVREIERCATKGSAAIAFLENPFAHGLPAISNKDAYWEPVFAAAHDTRMPLCMQSAPSSSPESLPDTPVAVASISGMLPSIEWLYSGYFRRYPNLKLVYSGQGISWIPYVLDRAQQVATFHRDVSSGNDASAERNATENSDVPSGAFTDDLAALFREHVFASFIRDEFGTRNLDAVGMDNVMIETDYPHCDSSWPDSIRTARKVLGGCTDDELFEILQGTARRVFNFRPAPYPSRLASSIATLRHHQFEAARRRESPKL